MKKAFYIAVGTFLMALGTVWFALRANLVTGGASGIAIAVAFLGKRAGVRIPLAFTVALLNLPLFLISLKQKGLKYVGISLYSASLFSIFLEVCENIPPFFEINNDDLTSAFMAGFFMGTGMGIVLKCGSTTGGTDMFSEIIRHSRPYIKISSIINIVDSLVIVLGMLIFGPVKGFYAIVSLFVTTYVMNFLLEGGERGKAVWIFSSDSEKIGVILMELLKRGATSFKAKGLYTKDERDVLFIAVKEREIPILRKTVKNLDKDAFMVINDIKEVSGDFRGRKIKK